MVLYIFGIYLYIYECVCYHSSNIFEQTNKKCRTCLLYVEQEWFHSVLIKIFSMIKLKGKSQPSCVYGRILKVLKNLSKTNILAKESTKHQLK